MMKPRVIIPVADGTEELEAVTIIDLLRRAEIDTVVTGDKEIITCSRGVKIRPDILFSELSDGEYFDAVILPGGLFGVENLSSNNILLRLLEKQKNSKSLFGAICAAPGLLKEKGLLDKDSSLTSHPSISDKFRDFNYLDTKVVKDGKLITSRGAGTAIDFALSIITELTNAETAEKIATDIVYNKT